MKNKNIIIKKRIMNKKDNALRKYTNYFNDDSIKKN